MICIDTHQHFWTYDPDEYDWMGPELRPIQRDYGPPDLAPELAAAGVAGTVLVEARGHLDETANLLSIAERTPFVLGVVGWLPLTEPGVAAHLERVAALPKLRGIRHWLGASEDLAYMFGRELRHGIGLLERHGLSFDLMLWPAQLGVVPRVVDQHPKQVFILDHLAKPFIRQQQLEPWRSALVELARRPNVYCKLSGLATEAAWDCWTAENLKPYLDTALEAFTPQRLMFGSDWPVCTLATGYQRWIQTLRGWLGALSESEQARILGGTALEVYGLARALDGTEARAASSRATTPTKNPVHG
jgi:L-fuconolactonase